ncbi:MAG: hypothetical protein VX949_05965 [Planctomycetota bacterium]|nr:hypothetical protein [Planctomycetota bacterium]
MRAATGKVGRASFCWWLLPTAISLWILILPQPCEAQLVLEKSTVDVSSLRQRQVNAHDGNLTHNWHPMLIMVNNQYGTDDGVFDIEISGNTKLRSNSQQRKFSWRHTVEVAAGAEAKRVLVGFPNCLGSGGPWYNNHCQIKVWRNGTPLHMDGYPEISEDSVAFDSQSTRSANEYCCLQVTLSGEAVVPSQRFIWPRVTGMVESTTWIGSGDLPLNREALLGFDFVLLDGVDPEDVSAGQRNAIREAVRGGVCVILRPDGQGRGLRWISGLELEPRVHSDGGGAERIVFPIEGIGERISEPTGSGGLSSCVQIEEGLGRWLALELAEGQLAQGVIHPDRHPMHLGSAISVIETKYPFQHVLAKIDLLQRGADPLQLIFWIGLAYVLVLWPSIGFILKKRGMLPHLLWLQPVLAAACIAAVFVLSLVRLGVTSRNLEEVLIIREPNSRVAVAMVIESHYSPTGTADESVATNSMPRFPLAIGADRDLCSYLQHPDGSTTSVVDRRIRSLSHEARCEVIKVPLMERLVMQANTEPRRIAMSKGVSSTAKLFEARPGEWLGGELFPGFQTASGALRAATYGMMRTTASAFLEESERNRLGIEPETMVTIWDGNLDWGSGQRK